MSKYKWPDEVPILSARNLCRHVLANGKGQRCLLGHCETAKLSTAESWIGFMVFPKVRLALLRAARQLGLEGAQHQVAAFNDDKRNTKTQLARVWNLAMANLGYVVGNPEAKAVKK